MKQLIIMDWQSIITLLAGGLLGFLLKILHGKIFEKKVKLYFELDKPAVFSVIPPTVCFQNIRIFNKGNLPSNSIRINLNRQTINDCNVTYKASSEEEFEEEINERILTLKFARLLPSEELTISLKSERPIPVDFLLSIKSDEMIARSIATQRESGEWMRMMTYATVIIAIAVFLMNTTFKDKSSQSPAIIEKQDIRPPFSLKLMSDKNIYTSGQKMELIYQFTNTGKEILKDLLFVLDIPGIELDYNIKYQRKNFINVGEQDTYKKIIPIPKNFPHGKHKVHLDVSTKSLEKSYREESSAYFEVQ